MEAEVKERERRKKLTPLERIAERQARAEALGRVRRKRKKGDDPSAGSSKG